MNKKWIEYSLTAVVFMLPFGLVAIGGYHGYKKLKERKKDKEFLKKIEEMKKGEEEG